MSTLFVLLGFALTGKQAWVVLLLFSGPLGNYDVSHPLLWCDSLLFAAAFVAWTWCAFERNGPHRYRRTVWTLRICIAMLWIFTLLAIGISIRQLGPSLGVERRIAYGEGLLGLILLLAWANAVQSFKSSDDGGSSSRDRTDIAEPTQLTR